MRNLTQQLRRWIGVSITNDDSPNRVPPNHIPAQPKPLALALEPRIMYDASAAAIGSHTEAAHTAGEPRALTGIQQLMQAEHTPVQQPLVADESPQPLPPTPRATTSIGIQQPIIAAESPQQPSSAASATVDGGHKDTTGIQQPIAATGQTPAAAGMAEKQVIFIDGGVADYQALVAGLPPGTEWVLLDPTKDGFAQMATYLKGHTGLDAIQLISHGAEGELQAGSAWLNNGDLSTYAAELHEIGNALKPSGDFLIYGCNVGKGLDGHQLTEAISILTHANVAAADHAVGAAAQGGSWVLDTGFGKVTTPEIFSAASEATYGYLLSTTVETYTGSASTFTTSSNVTSFNLDGIHYSLTGTQAGGYIESVTTLDPALPNIGDSESLGFDEGGVGGISSVTVSLVNGDAFSLTRLDLDLLAGTPSANAFTITPDSNSGKAISYNDPTDSYFTGNVFSVPGAYAPYITNANANNFAGVHSFTISGVNMQLNIGAIAYVDPAPPPVLTKGSGNTGFVEADPVGTSTPVVIDSSLTATDPTLTTETGATVTISNFATGDMLAFSNTNATTYGDITASYNGSGTLTMTSASGATTAQWQAALDSVTYKNTAALPSTTTRNITFTLTSAVGTSTAITETVTVTHTDQTPVTTTTGGSTAFTAGDNTASTPVVIDSGVTATDTDNTTLASATVSITGGFHLSEDLLSFTNDGSTMGNITGSYSAGVLTLTSSGSSATLAQWDHALEAVKYTDTAVTPNTATRTISFAVNDGTKTSAAVTKTVTVADTDQSPIATTSAGTTSFTEALTGASTPVVIDSGLTVTDLDNTTLASATVSITGGFHSAEDLLAFSNDGSTMGNITAAYNSATGVMTLTSVGATATKTQWQAALGSITYTDSVTQPSVPNTTNRTISFSLNDGAKTGPTATKTVSVTASDIAPVLTASGGSAAFVAGDNVASTPVAVDSGITVTDADNTTQASATVAITGSFHSGEDVLAFTNDGSTMGNITASYNSTTGVLSLTSASASATLAQWQAALRSVTYTDTAVTPNNATRTISFTSNDGTRNSATVTRSVTVTDTDQTPIATASAGTSHFTQADSGASTPIAVDSGLNVSDLDNTTLASATVAITGNFHSGEDVLAFTNDGSTMGNITASYNSGTGVLTLTSSGATATVTQWKAALDSVTYSDTTLQPSLPNTSNRTISFAVNDGTKTSATTTKTVLVTAPDSPPVLTASAGSAAFVAGDNVASTPVVIDGGITLTDSDNTTQASATVAITGNFHSGEDVLTFTNNGSTMGNITASYNSATGVLSLTSAGASATLAQWQAALRSVTYTDTAVTPNNATRTISFVSNDGVKNSTAVTRTVTVTDTDQTPILATSGGATSFTAGDNVTSTPVAVDGGLTVSDLDNATLASATVAITGNLRNSEDMLAYTNNPATMGNIAASYNSTTGVMTLTSAGATATLAQWQAALRSITYTDSAITPDQSTRTISFSVSDGTKTSAIGTKSVTVADVDQTPILTTTAGSSHFTQANSGPSTPVVVDAGITVSDRDNATQASATVTITGNFQAGEDVLSYTNTSSVQYGNIVGSYNAATGVLTLTSSGATANNLQWQNALQAITYADTSAGVANGTTRTVSFTINDGTKNSAVGTRSVQVTPMDQAPVATASAGITAFTAGDNVASTPVAIDTGITVTDADNTTQASATVAVTGNFHSGEDVLAFTNDGATMGNITSSYNSGTGVLTLTSASATATDAQWQAALRAVTYTDTAVTPNNSNRTVSFTVNDGIKNSATVTKTVSVTDTEQTPIATTSGGATAFTGNVAGPATPVAIDAGITLSDRDNTTLASATVSITGGLHASEDVLAFTSNPALYGNIAASYNAGTGVMTLTSAGATATVAQWQAALASITYDDTVQPPNTATRTISFSVNDGTKTSAVVTKSVTVATGIPAIKPVVTTTSGTSAFVESANGNTPPIVVDGGITVSDAASPTLQAAAISISGNFTAGQDVLGFAADATRMGDITGGYNAGSGTLMLLSASGKATLAQWQAALAAITYTDTAVDPNTASRTISFVVNDGFISSLSASKLVTVTHTPQAPQLTTSAGTTAFVEPTSGPSTGVVVDSGITVSDADSPTLASATVAVSGNFHSGEDVLALNGSFGNITASYNAATGVLTMSSAGDTATVAQWQAALAAVSYTDTAAAPDTSTRGISFQVSDGTTRSTVASKSVSVTATNQAPVLTASSGKSQFTQGDNAPGTPVAVDSGILVSDREATTLTSATVSITGNFHAGEDVLALGGHFGNIVGSYDSSTGVLTLTSAGGTATLAQWQSALASVTYADQAAIPATGDRTVSFSANDGKLASTAASKAVSVVDVDQSPIATTSGGVGLFVSAGGSGAPVVVDGGITLSDADNTTLASATVSITSNLHPFEDVLRFAGGAGNITGHYDAASGTLTLTSAGATATVAQWQAALRSVTYADTASTPYLGGRVISFVVNDGTKNSQPALRGMGILFTPHVPSDPAPSDPAATPVGTPFPPPSPPSVIVATGEQGPGIPPPATVTFGEGDVPSFTDQGHAISFSGVGSSAGGPAGTPASAVSSTSFDGHASSPLAPNALATDTVFADRGTPGFARVASLSTTSDAIALQDGDTVEVDASQAVRVVLPIGDFVRNDPDNPVTTEVKLVDGKPLPAWLHFDPVRGVLTGRAPKGWSRDMQIEVLTHDGRGHQARSEVKLRFQGAQQASPSGHPAKVALDDQLAQHGHRAQQLRTAALLQHARAIGARAQV